MEESHFKQILHLSHCRQRTDRVLCKCCSFLTRQHKTLTVTVRAETLCLIIRGKAMESKDIKVSHLLVMWTRDFVVLVLLNGPVLWPQQKGAITSVPMLYASLYVVWQMEQSRAPSSSSPPHTPVFKQGLFMFSFSAARVTHAKTLEKGNCKETTQK